MFASDEGGGTIDRGQMRPDAVNIDVDRGPRGRTGDALRAVIQASKLRTRSAEGCGLALAGLSP